MTIEEELVACILHGLALETGDTHSRESSQARLMKEKIALSSTIELAGDLGVRQIAEVGAFFLGLMA